MPNFRNSIHLSLFEKYIVYLLVFLIARALSILGELPVTTSFHKNSTFRSVESPSPTFASIAIEGTSAITASSVSLTLNLQLSTGHHIGVGPGLISSTRHPGPSIRPHDMDELSKNFAAALCYMFAGLALLGLLGNLLVILVITRNTHLQTTTNILIMCV